MFTKPGKFVSEAICFHREATWKFFVILIVSGYYNLAEANEDTTSLTLLQAYQLAQQHDAQIAAVCA